ncbi:hypothetical protein ACGFWI_07340 [Streptomyces sp. NPDC048434]|uniref:hypothetical protein n=1 Tax=Streptomyces sp. NPDC048434 TaxID=3365549 RepID=UPI003723A768
MSDSGDTGYDDGSDSGSSSLSARSSGVPSWSVLRRAMRWETLVLLLILVVLAAAAS